MQATRASAASVRALSACPSTIRGRPRPRLAAGPGLAPRSAPPPPCRRLPAAGAAAGEPFQPERTFHKGVVDSPEEPASLFGLATFSDVYYYLNLAYWGLLLASVLTGNDLVSRLSHFENYTTAMCAASVAFTAFHAARFVRDVRGHMQSEARADWRQLLRYAWNALFWLGFVLWYCTPAVPAVSDTLGTPAMVACLFGALLAATAALQAGMFSFMGSPQVPRRLSTGGVYALCRHPQALGNMLFLIGFSLAGGSVWASTAFVAAFQFYVATVVPVEERMLREAFGDRYAEYSRRTPRFAWALALLAGLTALLIWRYQPWAVPIDASPPPLTKT